MLQNPAPNLTPPCKVLSRVLLVVHPGPVPLWALRLATALQTTRSHAEEALLVNVLLFDAARNEIPPELRELQGDIGEGQGLAAPLVRYANAQGQIAKWEGAVGGELDALCRWIGDQIGAENGPARGRAFAATLTQAWRTIDADETREARGASDAAYMEMFTRLDRDMSGTVELGELVEAIREAQMAPQGEEQAMAEEHMKAIDADFDGKITPQEWLTFFQRLEARAHAPGLHPSPRIPDPAP